MKEEVRRWLDQAKRDIKSAKNSFDSGDYYIASLLCQQAVEKMLKSLYLKRFNKIKKIHNLVILAKVLKLPDDIIEKCDKLNPIYVDTRYPDASGSLPYEKYSEERSRMDIKIAEEIIKWLKKKI